MDSLKKVYFLGIGGIGMSALARYFRHRGAEVYGYDVARTILTKKLEDEGMHIHYESDVTRIPEGIELVIVTPAIPGHHEEWQWFVERGYTIMKRAEVLGSLSRASRTIAVAGTHGKTTTSSFITHILKYCGTDVTAFLGGILSGYDTNFFYGDSEWTVVEADEYDRSFLRLSPDILVIISLDADHLDIYEDVGTMYAAYEELCHRIKPGGSLILGCDVTGKFSADWSDALKEKGINIRKLGHDFHFDRVVLGDGRYHFDYVSSEQKISLVSGLAGMHNVMNTCLATDVTKIVGTDDGCIAKAAASFKGIRRRFDVLWRGEKVLVDDYAHHPSELAYAVQTAKEMFPGKRILGVFQPHLYSRTKDFYRDFARSLEGLDEIWLMPVYPAREEPIAGVQSEMIYNLIRNDNKELIYGHALVSEVDKKDDFDILLTLGASDLDKYHNDLIEVLKKKH